MLPRRHDEEAGDVGFASPAFFVLCWKGKTEGERAWQTGGYQGRKVSPSTGTQARCQISPSHSTCA